jgi:amino acid transporter
MAAVAVVFGTYFNQLLIRLGDAAAPESDALTAALAITAVTAVNCTGARAGSTAQNVFMSLKILAILTLVLCGLLAADARWSVLGGQEAAGDWLAPDRETSATAADRRQSPGHPPYLAAGACSFASSFNAASSSDVSWLSGSSLATFSSCLIATSRWPSPK